MSSVQQTGRAAAASGILMVLGVQGEWLLDAQRDDGTVTNLPAFVVLIVTATAGFGLLVVAVRGVRGLVPANRSARVGGLLTLVGAGLLVGFGVVCVVTAVVTGSPLEVSFLAFLLGMLLLALGGMTWGLALRRRALPTSGVRWMLMVAGIGALCALAIEPDPWHDIALTVSYAAWTVLGVLLLRSGSRLGAVRTGDQHRLGHADAAQL